MSQAGYTLAETLTALAIMGLAMGGVASGMYVISRQQFAVTDGVARQVRTRGLSNQIEALLALRGPYRAHEPVRFSGDARGFAFECGEAQRCAVELAADRGHLMVRGPEGHLTETTLEGSGELAFLYQGSLSAARVWPPGDLLRQPLTSISLVRDDVVGQEQVIFVARVTAEQPLECQFDTVMQDCR